ncbi:MAG: hypothetical protein S4CHLAM81_10370 [Chlamydiales bacterium]|nr:hypothetical protein [Chlamydiales bacterium]MCH9635815.1 hypothetical protein [Chlamydiales bacterium]
MMFIPTTLFGHLVIHMDINRTIIASDVTQGLGLEQIVNLSLAKKYVDSWEEGCEEMSYFDYVYTKLYPGPRRDRALRKVRRDTIHGFIDHLKSQKHPFYAKAMTTMDEAHSVMENRFIFPSFLKLIDHLEQKGEPYTLVFRTFGTDLDRIIEEMGWDIPKAHYKEGRLHTAEGIIDSPEQMNSFFKKHKWIGVRDDYHYWNQNDELKEFGKQFPIEGDALFFDDNIEPDSRVNIVAPFDTKSGKPLEILPLIAKGMLVPVITVDAILDELYFVNHLK